MRYKNLDRLFRQTARQLSCSDCPFLEARLLIQKAAGLSENEFYSQLGAPVSSRLAWRLASLVQKRRDGWPLAYILGRKEFWSLEFKVNRWVLIPRPETELLVEKVLSLPLHERPRILDVGTGCGNIAIALAKEKPGARVVASDISRRALQLAVWNARKNGVNNIVFVHSDLLRYFIERRQRFEVIVSNPPYVSERDWARLDRPVRDYEPKNALVSGPTGLEMIEKLVRQSWHCLKPGGFLVFEFGPNQENEIRQLLRPGWSEPEIIEDYSGWPRVMAVRKSGRIE